MAVTFARYDYETKTYSLVTEYSGRVLKIWRNQSYQIMSDIWGSADEALVMDENDCPKTVVYQVYDGPTDPKAPLSTAEVDATDEVKAKYLNWLENREFDRLLSQEQDRVQQIEKGCIAKVVSGRNGQGAQGKVVVIMSALYGMGYRAVRMNKYGIATSDVTYKKALPNGKVVDAHKDMVWAWARNVKRVDIAEIDKDALRKEAKERALRYYQAA